MVETVSNESERKISCHIRPMRRDDVSQVSKIDREAFPTMWPPVNFNHELDNRLAHYLVAYQDIEVESEPPKTVPMSTQGSSWLTWFNNVFGKKQPPVYRAIDQHIQGFIGIWMLADEAHVINIAVKESYRGRGVGELLLIAALDLAIKLKASIMTLEVRASNKTAQNLYTKYTFIDVGVRRGYYTDNKEDAILMTTENLSSPAFQERFQQNKEAHFHKLGIAI